MRLAPIAAALLALVAAPARCPPRAAIELATFNIEDFPRSELQVRLAFAEIRALGVPAVALQEITSPRALAEAALRELGPDWRTLTSTGPDNHRLGVAWDSARLELTSARTRDETRVDRGTRPSLEVRLAVRGSGTGTGTERVLRLLVVHLKAGGAEWTQVRARQLAQLDALVAEGRAMGDEVVLLGDFNATTDADRAAIAALSARTGLGWATRELACTAYWDRSDGCRGTALDHVLAPRPLGARVGGGCAVDGCAPRDRCPAWRAEVSDHCPVVAKIP